jgi:hypothetical protein
MEAELMEMLTDGLMLAIQALVGLLLSSGLYWLRQNLRQREYQMVVWIIRQAVLAAEQLGGDGGEKKRAAVEMAEQWLARYGIKLPVARIAEVVETAVLEELNRERP